MFPFDRNYFRSADGPRRQPHIVSTGCGARCRSADKADAEHVSKAREAAAMVATARWMYRSALERNESRGMARRLDFPQQDPASALLCSVRRPRRGLDPARSACSSMPVLEAAE